MKHWESTGFIAWIKRKADRLKGPRFLKQAARPRCLAPFCGELLTEEELVLGHLYCAICTPAVERTGQTPRPGAPPVLRPIRTQEEKLRSVRSYKETAS